MRFRLLRAALRPTVRTDPPVISGSSLPGSPRQSRCRTGSGDALRWRWRLPSTLDAHVRAGRGGRLRGRVQATGAKRDLSGRRSRLVVDQTQTGTTRTRAGGHRGPCHVGVRALQRSAPRNATAPCCSLPTTRTSELYHIGPLKRHRLLRCRARRASSTLGTAQSGAKRAGSAASSASEKPVPHRPTVDRAPFPGRRQRSARHRRCLAPALPA